MRCCAHIEHLEGKEGKVLIRPRSFSDKPSVELRVKVSNKFVSGSKVISPKLRSVTVKQGSNVQLECSSDANPVPTFIEWHQNVNIASSSCHPFLLGKGVWERESEEIWEWGSEEMRKGGSGGVRKGRSEWVIEGMRQWGSERVSVILIPLYYHYTPYQQFI